MAEYDFSGLRDYQKQAVLSVESLWSQGKRSMLVQSPTGSGKSRIIRTIIDRMHGEKKGVLAVAHRGNLIRQLSDELLTADIRHGIIKAGFPHLRYRVQVCSVQTLFKRLDLMDEPALIVYDEAHHCSASTYQAVLKHWPNALTLGFTATPKRQTGLPLSDTFEDMIPGPSVRWLIDNGYLSDFDYLAPPSVAPVSGIPITCGDFAEKPLEAVMNKKQITGNAVDHYRAHSDHLPAIAACVSIQHALDVAREFCDSGYRFKAIHSKMDEEEIYRSIRELGDGTLDGLTNCDLIGEGTDIPVVTTLIGLKPTLSLSNFLQYCGRILRKHPLKDKAIDLDHVGNYLLHGLPDDDRVWDLSAESGRTKEVSAYKTCPDCFRVDIPKGAQFCPYCFAVFGGQGGASRIPEQVDGELVNVRGLQVDNDLIVRIAREARSIREAVALAGSEEQGERIWRKILRNPA